MIAQEQTPSTRSSATLVGVLYIISTVAGVLSVGLVLAVWFSPSG